MLIVIPILVIIVAVIMALVLRGKWYKYSLLFSAFSILLLVYAKTVGSVKISYNQCFSNIHLCAQQRSAPVVRFTDAVLLALLVAAIALLLTYRKSQGDVVVGSASKKSTLRYILITISLLFLIGTFVFVGYIFYALSQI